MVSWRNWCFNGWWGILEGATNNEEHVGISEFEKTLGTENKKGVLTAVEDFIKSHPEYEFNIYKTDCGGKSTLTGDYKQCGVLIKTWANWQQFF